MAFFDQYISLYFETGTCYNGRQIGTRSDLLIGVIFNDII